MKLNEIISVLDAEIYNGKETKLDMEITIATSSDLMSDVLASKVTPDLLLTGLNNAQVVRTSSVSGIKVVIVVRGKKVDEKVIELAKEEGIILLGTNENLFESSGRLYTKGIKSK